MVAINWSNVTDMAQIPAAANTATGGNFWGAMVFLMWLVIFSVMVAWGWEIALMLSCFVLIPITILLSYAGLISFNWVLIYVGIILIMFLYIAYSGSRRA